jgi:CheY-like chemotaxis protein
MAENNLVILCVDDDPAVLKPLEIMLQRRGFRVVTANGGRAAIELFPQIKFDAVILDYLMPGISGGEVARELRKERQSIPIILHTGYKDIDDPLLANVSCTLPKGSFSFLMTKLNDLLQIHEPVPVEAAGNDIDSVEPASADSAHVA